jgi:hypothetical protein
MTWIIKMVGDIILKVLHARDFQGHQKRCKTT